MAGYREDVVIRFGGATSPSLNRTFKGIQTQVSGLRSLIAGIGVPLSIAEVARQTLSAAIELDKLDRAFTQVAGSSEAAAREMDYVRGVADRLGLDIQVAASSYLRLFAAAKGTNLEGAEARRIFEAVSGAMGRLGKSSAETEGALLAIEQMISKGRVSAEELRGQLGERLPGAFRLAADAMGVTTQELDKLLQTGQLTAEQLLPRLAKELERVYDTGKEVGGLAAEWARLRNVFMDIAGAIGDALLPRMTELTSQLRAAAPAVTGFFGGLKSLQEWLNNNAPLLAQALKLIADPMSMIVRGIQSLMKGKNAKGGAPTTGGTMDDYNAGGGAPSTAAGLTAPPPAQLEKDSRKRQEIRRRESQAAVSDTRAQARAEGEIWQQYHMEINALQAGDAAAAEAAKRAQMDAFNRMVAAGASDARRQYYEEMVQAQAEIPPAKLRVVMSEEDLASLPPKLQQSLQSQQYDVTLRAQVIPELLMGADGSLGPLGDAADALGAQ